MRVLVCPLEDDASSWYRLCWPATALAAQGADVAVGKLPAGIWRDTPGQLPKLETLTEAPKADVVVIQRPIYHWLPDAVRLLQAKGVAVVCDLDDDFSAIDQRNVAWRGMHPSRADRNWQHAHEVAKLADLVTVTTPALGRRYGRHGRVRVLPNRVPAAYLETKRQRDRGPLLTGTGQEGTWVGWSGAVSTHPHDLQVTRGAVARAIQEAGAGFRVVGTGQGVKGRLGLADEPEVSGWVPLADYPAEVARLDVGIVPLADTVFNAAKSALTGLNMASVGVPFVASPTEDYARIAADGLGLLAHKPKEWRRILKRLIASPEERADRAGRGREVVEARHTIEGRCVDWLAAWAEALLERRAA